MAGVSKERAAELHQAALDLVDAVAHDRIADAEESRQHRRCLAEQMAEQTGCSLRTAMRRVVHALRIKRHPSYAGAGGYKAQGAHPADVLGARWGGARPGAGRPAKAESSPRTEE